MLGCVRRRASQPLKGDGITALTACRQRFPDHAKRACTPALAHAADPHQWHFGHVGAAAHFRYLHVDYVKLYSFSVETLHAP